MAPCQPLPYGDRYTSADDYISALLAFVTGSALHQALCGGVHILDFLTREPDLYANLIPEEWRSWFKNISIDDILDLLLRESIDALDNEDGRWRGHILPPKSLLDFVMQIRELTLDRSYAESIDRPPAKLDRRISVGMNLKKQHEVSHFASFVNSLADASASASSVTYKYEISHLVDFGSGQNYLGRVLASPQYQRHVVALESRLLNIEGARKMDIHAKLAQKPIIWRNKKMWQARGRNPTEAEQQQLDNQARKVVSKGNSPNSRSESPFDGNRLSGNKAFEEVENRITYIEHNIEDGFLRDVIEQLQSGNRVGILDNSMHKPELLVMSLHSCGNLVHHGLRSLVLNPEVKIVAMIGCCYNLCTERLGPPTYKLPTLHLRSANQRLTKASLTCDPHGFPMSQRFLKHQHVRGSGIRFNITARMMAVQAPSNWTKDEYERFFTKHFYRALIQRIFLDTGFVDAPIAADEVIGGSVRGWSGGKEPIIIGSLTKSCHKSFVTYVRGAVRKICIINPKQGSVLIECLKGLTDEAIAEYEKKYISKRHELCVMWSLMAFAAQLVECAIVSDRWQFLMEQEEISEAWVQRVFDYKQSPRNLAIVGIKK